MKEKFLHSETPFKDKLVDSGIEADSLDLKTLQSLPGKLVREYKEYFDVDNIHTYDQFLDETLLEFKKAKQGFDRMKEYGIHIVDADTVIGKNEEGTVKVFTVVDRVFGENLFDISDLTPEIKREIEDLFLNFAKYYSNASDDSNTFWYHFHLGQFVYGNKLGEDEKHLYLVDIEPFFDTSEEFIDSIINLFYGEIDILNKKFPSIDFSKVPQFLNRS